MSSLLELVPQAIEETIPLLRRARLIRQAIEFWMVGGDSKFVYWVERRGRGTYLQATPIDVAETLATRLMDKVQNVILTSATLTVNGEFEYAQSRLGLPEARTLAIDSPYDYPKQVLFYVPRQLPDPRQPSFLREATDEIERILEASSGRAFVLFTSYQQMRQAHESLREHFPSPYCCKVPRRAIYC